MQFEELHQIQSQWTVYVPEILMPTHQSFHKCFWHMIENCKNLQTYIRYTVDDLQRMLGEFFAGIIWNEDALSFSGVHTLESFIGSNSVHEIANRRVYIVFEKM